MSIFLISQVLVSFAIIFDLMSFQFKDRKRIIACLFCGGLLISIHFILLEQWTAALLMVIAVTRYLISYFSTAPWLKYLLCIAAILAAIFTYSNYLSILSCTGSIVQTYAAFCKNDRRLRQLMFVGCNFWLLHNFLVGSPVAVVMELLFISSNVIGYYRYYYKRVILKS